jgi:hypothetical protein
MKVKDDATAPELARLVYIRNTKIAGVPYLLLRQPLPNCCPHSTPVFICCVCCVCAIVTTAAALNTSKCKLTLIPLVFRCCCAEPSTAVVLCHANRGCPL